MNQTHYGLNYTFCCTRLAVAKVWKSLLMCYKFTWILQSDTMFNEKFKVGRANKILNLSSWDLVAN